MVPALGSVAPGLGVPSVSVCISERAPRSCLGVPAPDRCPGRRVWALELRPQQDLAIKRAGRGCGADS